MYFFHRRECSLDREIAASGYTKEMQEGGELLYPPTSDEDDDTTEVSEFVEDAENKLNFFSKDKENNAGFMYEVGDFSESRTSHNFMYSNEEADTTERLNMSKLSSALEKVEGQAMLWKSGEDAESSVIAFFEGKSVTENAGEVKNQTGQGRCCNDKENEDKCPDLVDLSTLKEKLGHYR